MRSRCCLLAGSGLFVGAGHRSRRGRLQRVRGARVSGWPVATSSIGGIGRQDAAWAREETGLTIIWIYEVVVIQCRILVISPA